MQRLRPLKVPWQVSPSTPFLRLLATEQQEECPTQITFVAHFGLNERTDQQGIGFEKASQASNPYQTVVENGKESKSHSLVKIEFQAGCWARMSPAFSGREVLNPHEFDSSLIPYSSLPTDIGAWVRDFQSLWMKSGNCPNPGAYTIEFSEWIERVGYADFQHFLIKGHDAYIEVLARDWKWEEIQKLPQSW